MRSVVCFLFTLILFISSAAIANPPNAVHANYNTARNELVVTVQHPVNYPKDHYIEGVVIFLNGREVASHAFRFQSSRRNQTMPPFRFMAVPGSQIRIVAYCNKSGKYEKVLTVE